MNERQKEIGCVAIIMLLVSVLASIIIVGNNREKYFLQEKYLIHVYGEIIKKKKGVYFRDRATVIWYSYMSNNETYSESFQTYNPELYKIGEKIEVWYSSLNPKYSKTNIEEIKEKSRD